MVATHSHDETAFVKTLSDHPQGVVALVNLWNAFDKSVLASEDVVAFISEATELWRIEIAKGLPDASPLVAVMCLRHAAGNQFGFRGPRGKIPERDLSPVHFINVDFESATRYQLNVSALISESTIALESCPPYEFTLAAREIVANMQSRTADGHSFVRINASVGSPLGVVWSTTIPIDDLTSPSIPTANNFRNRLGLVDSHWSNGKALMRYTVDSQMLGDVYRPTPMEGGNSRFRFDPRKPK